MTINKIDIFVTCQNFYHGIEPNCSFGHVCISLHQLVSYISSSFNMAEEGLRQLSSYPEKVAAVTHVFLPAGQLLVMNHKVVRQFQRDLEKIFADKV